MIRPCGLGTHTFRVGCQDAHGLRAGALIAVPGGLCAKEVRQMAATDFDDRLARLKEHVVEPTAEELLAKAEQMFAAEGDTVWTRCAMLAAECAQIRERHWRNEWEDEDDA